MSVPIPMTTTLPPQFDRLPGADLVREGIEDVSAGRSTLAAALVQIAPQRLSRVGIHLATIQPSARERVFSFLIEDEQTAHGRFNALVDRFDSFLDGADHVARS
ncbi:hypothetical protein AB0L40_25340 [Patulibacter sp. NPDC049589]|uniref:hypothetical protein n=1 Tax=Patulibacter sp. NPDC049589 TaxID=3154731 RepID=UPI003428FC59